MLSWYVAHHLAALLGALLTLLFAGSVLDRRRPVGSAFAWLFAIAFIPLVAVPAYLAFGGRKVQLRAGRKPKLGAGKGGVQHGQVRWLDDGQAAFLAFMAEIGAARASIRIITFVIGDDATGRAIVAALSAAARAGVAVELVVDDFLFVRAPKLALAELRAAGGSVARFMPLLHWPLRGRSNLRNHRKLAIFDGERAILGGMNLADEYMGGAPSAARWRDLSLCVAGDVVDALDEVFRADLAFATGRALPPARGLPAVRASQPVSALGGPRSAMRVVPSGPDVLSDPIYDALLTAIYRADRRVWVSTPYFVPDDALLRALEVARRRGVDVRVVVPARSNYALIDAVAAPALRALAAQGAGVYRYTPSMLHAKAVLIDERLGVVGSANFDIRSLWLDFEIALALEEPREVAWLARWFEGVFAASAVGAPAAGPLRMRVQQVARLFSPLL